MTLAAGETLTSEKKSEEVEHIFHIVNQSPNTDSSMLNYQIALCNNICLAQFPLEGHLSMYGMQTRHKKVPGFC